MSIRMPGLITAVLLVLIVSPAAINAMQDADAGAELAKRCMKKLGNGEYDQALQFAGRANAAGYLGPEPDYARSLVHLRRGQYDSAETYAQRAIASDYRYEPGYQVLASAQAHLFEWDSVEKTCRYALTLSPNSTVLTYYLDQSIRGQAASSRSMLITVALIVLFVLGLWQTWNSGSVPEQWPLATTVAIGGAVAAIMYSGFYTMSSLIWSLNTQIPFSEILSPARDSAFERDGIEGYVLFAITIAHVVLSVLLFNLLRNIQRRMVFRAAITIMAVVAGWYLLSVGFFPPEAAVAADRSTLIAVCVGVLVVALSFVFLLNRFPRVTSVVLLIALIPVSFIAVEPISMFDYSFILAPALRIVQGAALSDIYMQYDLLLSLVSALWLKLGGSLDRVQWIGQASMYLFYAMAFFFARRYFLDSRLPAVFLIGLLVVRSYANIHDPSALLQVTSLRLDLWLILVFLSFQRGVWHWSVGLTLGILIIVHRNFGLLYLAAYMCTAFVLLFNAIQQVTRDEGRSLAVLRQQTWLWIRRIRLNAALVALSFGLIFMIYGGVGAESALMYQRLGLGMMMITKESFYWLVPVMFSSVVILLWQLQSRLPDKYFETSLFMVFLAIGSSMYYFGRSHENNIVNISGILLFVAFSLFDLHQLNLVVASERGDIARIFKVWSGAVGFRNAALATSLLLLVTCSYIYSEKISSRVSTQLRNLRQNRWSARPVIDGINLAGVAAVVRDRDKVYVLDQQRDFSYYYYGQYPLVGYFNPYAAWVVKPNFVPFADSLLRMGYSIVVPSFETMLEVIPDLNYNVVRESGGIHSLNQVETEYLLTESSNALAHISFPDTALVRSVYRALDLSSGSFTFEVLVDPAAANAAGTIIFGAVDDDNRGVVLETTGSAEAACRVLLLNGSQFEALPQMALKPGTLNHLAVSGDTKTLFVYHNGVLVYSGPQPKMLRQDRTTLVVGTPYGRAGGARGLIREFKARAICLGGQETLSSFY